MFNLLTNNMHLVVDNDKVLEHYLQTATATNIGGKWQFTTTEVVNNSEMEEVYFTDTKEWGWCHRGPSTITEVTKALEGVDDLLSEIKRLGLGAIDHVEAVDFDDPWPIAVMAEGGVIYKR